MSFARNAKKFELSRPSSLKKPAARSVGREMTTPKPGPKPKVQLPTYEEQDQEQGEHDEDKDESETAQIPEDEKAPETKGLKPTRAPTKAQVSTDGAPRTKTTTRAPPKQTNSYVPESSNVPHLALLTLVTDYKSIVPKTFPISYYLPDFRQLTYINAAAASLITGRKQVTDAHPMYNSIYTRTAIHFLAQMHVLRCREHANVITDSELKALKRFRAAFDFNKLRIPGPYVSFFATLGVHLPSSKRFLEVVPSFPSIDHLVKEDGTAGKYLVTPGNPECLAFAAIPMLMGMCSILASTENVREKQKMKKTDDSDEQNMTVYFQGKSFVPYHRDRKNHYAFLGHKRDGTPSAAGVSAYFAQSPAMCAPFPDTPGQLAYVHEATPSVAFPDHTKTMKVDTHMQYFTIDGETSHLEPLFDALAIESSFFEGSTSFELLDVETGVNATCVRTVELDSTATYDGEKWFQREPFAEDGITVESRDGTVSDLDLQFALLSGVITCYTDAPAGCLLEAIQSDQGQKHNLHTSAEAPIYGQGNTARKIVATNHILDQLRTTIRISMLRDFADVL